MFEVTQEELSEKFRRAWQAAGRHLGRQGGEGLSWLRASLNPPMAEHLSFRCSIYFLRQETQSAPFNSKARPE